MMDPATYTRLELRGKVQTHHCESLGGNHSRHKVSAPSCYTPCQDKRAVFASPNPLAPDGPKRRTTATSSTKARPTSRRPWLILIPLHLTAEGTPLSESLAPKPSPQLPPKPVPS